MKIALFAAAAMIAAPALAQTTPTTPMQDQSSMPAPAPTTPATPPTTMPDGAMPAAPAPAPMAPDSAAPMPMAGGKLPWCRKGQYTACREHENAKGAGMSKM